MISVKSCNSWNFLLRTKTTGKPANFCKQINATKTKFESNIIFLPFKTTEGSIKRIKN